RPTTTWPRSTPMVAGTAPASLTTSCSLRPASRLSGRGRPCVSTVDSSATTGAPPFRAASTCSPMRRRSGVVTTPSYVPRNAVPERRGNLTPVEAPELAAVWPLVEQVGVGSVAGFIAGYALKKVGKVVAIVLGLLFIAVQLLAWSGFISVNWGVVQERVDPMLTGESLQGTWSSLVALLTYNVPFAAAFVPAFILGLKRG